MGNSKEWYALMAITYCCLALAYLWPYLTQTWQAFRENRPIKDVHKPAANKVMASAIAFLGVVMWTLMYLMQW